MSTVQSFNSPLFQPIVPMDGGAYSVAPGYLAKFYAAGTAIPKTIYTDSELLVPYPAPANIAVLDAQGSTLIYLGAGAYKLVLTDPSGNPVPGWTIDNINGEGSFGTGFVNSFADLVDVNTTLNKYTYIGGYYLPGDGGHGMFFNETSSDSADGGYVQDSNFDPTKKWYRIPDENGKVRTASFGAIGLGQNRTTNLQAADTYATTNALGLLFNVFSRSDTMTFSAASVEFAVGAFLRGFSAATVTFTGIVSGPDSIIFSHSLGGGLDVVLSNPSQVSNPYWFEAYPSNSGGANATAFAKWKAAGAGLFVVPAGTWAHTGAFTPSTSITTIFYGSVGGNLPGTFYGPVSVIKGNIGIDATGSILLDGDIDITGNLSAANMTAATDVNTGNLYASGTVQGEQIFSNTSIDATNNVTAGGFMTAGGNVRAGNSGAGELYARAGESGASFSASGVGQVVVGTGNCTLSEESVTGLYGGIKITCAGTTDDNTNPVVTVTVGGLTVFQNSTLSTSGATYTYLIEVLVLRTGVGSSFSIGKLTWNTPAGAINSASDSRTAAIDWTASNTIAHSASATNVKQLTMFEFLPYDGT